MRLNKSYLFIAFFGFTAFAQEADKNNQSDFDDITYRRSNVYRSASGVPGPQ